ncbi:MAG: RNA polymerase sigma factor [Saprospiraceae bacterium]|nr:RNA polymerase sigma factor [Saprospiraceae bacterium]
MQDQDQHVIEACLRGDRAAQRALYERFRSDMFRVCLRYAANREDAEDYLQEGFITVFRDLQQFRGDGPLGGWIRMVMVRASLQQLRKRK